MRARGVCDEIFTTTKLWESNVFTGVCPLGGLGQVHHMHHGIGHIPYPLCYTLPLG